MRGAMSVARLAFLLACATTFLASCGPAIPPAGNYATVSGRIVDAGTGAGIAGATVVVNVVLSAITDASGTYRVVSVPTGSWEYAVQAPPPYASIATVDNPPPLTPGEARTLNLSLPRR
ncbi:MAG: hypothetical protein NVSMB19_11620 [Vulcanimicrobiaceae bacterium]